MIYRKVTDWELRRRHTRPHAGKHRRTRCGPARWLAGVTATVALLAPPAARADGGSWLRERTNVSGYVRNVTQFFIDTQEIEYVKNKNQVATFLNRAQLDIGFQATPKDEVFVRLWAAHEQPYPFEKGSNIPEEFYDYYGPRDAWWKHKEGPLTTIIGSQIVTWGESTAFRVGDVVNAQNLAFAFAFASLEESRVPQNMLRAIYQMPDLGMAADNSLELVLQPGWDPLLWSDDYADNRYSHAKGFAGRVSILPPSGGKFAARSSGTPLAFRRVDFAGGHRPLPKWVIPRATTENFQAGGRFHTLIGQNEFTFIYWHSNEYTPTLRFAGNIPNTTLDVVEFTYPRLDNAGVTFNRPIVLPDPFALVPIVVRTEAIYKFNKPFPTSERAEFDALDNSDLLTYMVAIDSTNNPANWLTATGTLNLNFEFIHDVRLQDERAMDGRANIMQMLLNTSTSWYSGNVQLTAPVLYNLDGGNLVWFPTLTLVAPWNSNLQTKFRWIGFATGDKRKNYGLYAGKDMLGFEVQYGFSVIPGIL